MVVHRGPLDPVAPQQLEVEAERHRRPALADPAPRVRRDRHRRHPRRRREALLRAAVGVVDPPRAHVERDPAERRHAVGEQQRVGAEHRRPELLQRVQRARRRLGVHDGDEPRPRVPVQRVEQRLVRHGLAPRRRRRAPPGHRGARRRRPSGGRSSRPRRRSRCRPARAGSRAPRPSRRCRSTGAPARRRRASARRRGAARRPRRGWRGTLGSRCPSIERRIAASTAGSTSDGPGPHSRRGGGSSVSVSSMTDQPCFPRLRTQAKNSGMTHRVSSMDRVRRTAPCEFLYPGLRTAGRAPTLRRPCHRHASTAPSSPCPAATCACSRRRRRSAPTSSCSTSRTPSPPTTRSAHGAT